MTSTGKWTAALAVALPMLALAAPAHATRVGEEKLPAFSATMEAAAHKSGGPKNGWRDNHGREEAYRHANDHARFKRHDSPCG